jgi:hypothetical protein
VLGLKIDIADPRVRSLGAPIVGAPKNGSDRRGWIRPAPLRGDSPPSGPADVQCRSGNVACGYRNGAARIVRRALGAVSQGRRLVLAAVVGVSRHPTVHVSGGTAARLTGAAPVSPERAELWFAAFRARFGALWTCRPALETSWSLRQPHIDREGLQRLLEIFFCKINTRCSWSQSDQDSQPAPYSYSSDLSLVKVASD